MSSGWPPGKSEVKPQSVKDAAAAPVETPKPAAPSTHAERRPMSTKSAR
jgi:hypothetical protein